GGAGRAAGGGRVGRAGRRRARGAGGEARPGEGDAPGALQIEAARRGGPRRGELDGPAAVAAVRGEGEGGHLVRGEDLGGQPLAPQLETDGGIGERAGGTPGAADRAAQATIAGGAVDEGQREGLEVEVERELALAERD